jgi:uncharacterized membrane protein AbrB (regulator of aidB expression)
MMQMRILAQHRYLLQVCLVTITTTTFVLVTDALSFRSPANAAWMLGLPICVGMVANVGWDRRCFMAMALLGVSLVVGMVIGVNFTSYR